MHDLPSIYDTYFAGGFEILHLLEISITFSDRMCPNVFLQDVLIEILELERTNLSGKSEIWRLSFGKEHIHKRQALKAHDSLQRSQMALVRGRKTMHESSATYILVLKALAIFSCNVQAEMFGIREFLQV